MSAHLPEYEMGLAQYLLAGVAACYRGFRLFDTPAVQAVVARYVGVYKAYRDIITSPVAAHVRRPDGQSIDGFCHANAFLPLHKGFCAFFNPATTNLTAVIPTNLYYTGITTTAMVSHEGGAPAAVALARDYTVPLTVSLGPRGVTWFVITSGDA